MSESEKNSRFTPGDLLVSRSAVHFRCICVMYLKTTKGFLRLLEGYKYNSELNFEELSLNQITNSEDNLIKIGNLAESFNKVKQVINADIEKYCVHS